MKKIIVLTIIGLSFLSAKGQFKWGVKAGTNLSNRSGFSGTGLQTGPIFTIQSSFLGMIPVGKFLIVQPSIGYYGKGMQFKNMQFIDNLGNDLGKGDENLIFNYIELSIPLQYKIDLNRRDRIFIGAGPYVAYAINGKDKVKAGTFSRSTDVDFNYSKRVDAGISFLITAQIKQHWTLSLNYDLGLINIYKNSSLKPHNNSAGLVIGYLLK